MRRVGFATDEKSRIQSKGHVIVGQPDANVSPAANKGFFTVPVLPCPNLTSTDT
jgi:hypothetical protein